VNRSSKKKVAAWMPATQRLVEQPLWVNNRNTPSEHFSSGLLAESGLTRASHAARNAALTSSRLSATPPFGPCGGARPASRRCQLNKRHSERTASAPVILPSLASRLHAPARGAAPPHSVAPTANHKEPQPPVRPHHWGVLAALVVAHGRSPGIPPVGTRCGALVNG
jgi:hypothetical protein